MYPLSLFSTPVNASTGFFLGLAVIGVACLVVTVLLGAKAAGEPEQFVDELASNKLKIGWYLGSFLFASSLLLWLFCVSELLRGNSIIAETESISNQLESFLSLVFTLQLLIPIRSFIIQSPRLLRGESNFRITLLEAILYFPVFFVVLPLLLMGVH